MGAKALTYKAKVESYTLPVAKKFRILDAVLVRHVVDVGPGALDGRGVDAARALKTPDRDVALGERNDVDFVEPRAVGT